MLHNGSACLCMLKLFMTGYRLTVLLSSTKVFIPEDQLSTPLIALELQSSQNFKDFYNFLQMCNS